MRIALVAPLIESVPPKLYGGTERVVSFLSEELVAQGHDVTLFASGDSATRARLEPVVDRSLRLHLRCRDPLVYQMLALERVFETAESFDVVHFHNDYLHFPLSRRAGIAHVTTLHGRLDLPELEMLYRRFNDIPLVSISDAQRAPVPWANWVATVHHGLPRDRYVLDPSPRGYLAFLGRISPEKRVDRAVAIARRCRIPLKVAAKIDAADTDYFNREIEPLMKDDLVEFVGEIEERDKQAFLGGALALLFPIDWPEPFGLVMIEAMACGTPTIAYARGSVPEILENGVNGFIVHDEDEAVEAVQRVRDIDRPRCRAAFEARFTADRMAHDYVEIYETIAAQVRKPLRSVSAR